MTGKPIVGGSSPSIPTNKLDAYSNLIAKEQQFVKLKNIASSIYTIYYIINVYN